MSYTYDAAGNLVSASGGKYQTVTYNSFNLPDSQNGLLGANGIHMNGRVLLPASRASIACATPTIVTP